MARLRARARLVHRLHLGDRRRRRPHPRGRSRGLDPRHVRRSDDLPLRDLRRGPALVFLVSRSPSDGDEPQRRRDSVSSRRAPLRGRADDLARSVRDLADDGVVRVLLLQLLPPPRRPRAAVSVPLEAVEALLRVRPRPAHALLLLAHRLHAGAGLRAVPPSRGVLPARPPAGDVVRSRDEHGELRRRAEGHLPVPPHRRADPDGDVLVPPPGQASVQIHLADRRVLRAQHHRCDRVSALALPRRRDGGHHLRRLEPRVRGVDSQVGGTATLAPRSPAHLAALLRTRRPERSGHLPCDEGACVRIATPFRNPFWGWGPETRGEGRSDLLRGRGGKAPCDR